MQESAQLCTAWHTPRWRDRSRRSLTFGIGACPLRSLEGSEVFLRERISPDLTQNVVHLQRRSGDESWLDSFLNAWAAVGKPTAFEYFTNESIDEWGTAALALCG